MIKAVLDNETLRFLMSIERAKAHFGEVRLPVSLAGKLRKSSRKKSSFASNRIEGNPLTEDQSNAAIDSSRRHYLKPEQEIRNYFKALQYLERSLLEQMAFSIDFLLSVQRIVVDGESPEKIGLRGPMPPGVLFAVYDDVMGRLEYIPPEAKDVRPLLEELVQYVRQSDDHPVVKAAIVHYQLVTIHPFEDGNGRTARLLSDYVLDLYGYGFNQIGSLEEYFAYDIDEYYRSLQMDLPVLYYDGRANPPHPEIWIHYFLRMMALHADKALELVSDATVQQVQAGFSFLSIKEREFIRELVRKGVREFTPTEQARLFKVTNRTVINWCANLVKNGFLVPNITGTRIRSYSLTEVADTIV